MISTMGSRASPATRVDSALMSPATVNWVAPCSAPFELRCFAVYVETGKTRLTLPFKADLTTA